MIVKETKIEKVWAIEIEPFIDHRGRFIELYNRNEYRKHFGIFFVQDDVSISDKDVLRGIHGDDKTWKLVTCVSGSFFAVVVQKKQDDTFTWESHHLSPSGSVVFPAITQLLIGPGRGLGILALEHNSILHYKQTEYYKGVDKQFTYKWDDPRINITWPIKAPILSKRDSSE